MTDLRKLSRRERQLMEVIYRLGPSTAADIQAALAEKVSNSAIRTFLRILEEKGYLRHEERGQAYVYEPVLPKPQAERQAIGEILDTFFADSVEGAVAALLDLKRETLTAEELDRLAAMIEHARKEGR